jgi:hypothetical protein
MTKKKNTPHTNANEPVFNIHDVPARHVDSLTDFSGSLRELKEHVDYLIHQFGEESHLYLDGGHNNVSVQLVTEGDIEKYQKKLQDDLNNRKVAQHEKDLQQYEKLKRKLGL